jgi:hypothetical protein
VAEETFNKIKKGAKQTGRGVTDTSEGTIETAEGILGGIKETAESVFEGAKDTVEGTKVGIEKTADAFEDTSKQASHARTYKSRRKRKTTPKRKTTRKGTKSWRYSFARVTALKRDDDSEIASKGQTGTDSAEAREKYRKQGMTEI